MEKDAKFRTCLPFYFTIHAVGFGLALLILQYTYYV